MRRAFGIIFALLFISSSLFAQSPEMLSYQAVIRTSANALVTNTPVGMRVSILQGSPAGTAVYVERHTPTTNANGLVTIEIGGGTVVSGTFASINWGNAHYFIRTETDPAGGTNYTITGTSQLLSVPYSLHSKTATTLAAPVGTIVGQILYWNGTAWVAVAPGNSGQVLTLVNGVPTWTGTSAGSTDVVNPTTGKIWMDRNLGASRVATSSIDIFSYGHLFQWGRGADGHQVRASATTAMLSTIDNPGHGLFITTSSIPNNWRSPQNDNLWQGESGVNNPCPSGYRLPTDSEWDAERLSWSSNNAAGAFASPLKLPIAGYRNTDGSVVAVGSFGIYWSSNVIDPTSRILLFTSTLANINSESRAHGFSVRCIKD